MLFLAVPRIILRLFKHKSKYNLNFIGARNTWSFVTEIESVSAIGERHNQKLDGASGPRRMFPICTNQFNIGFEP